MMSLKGFNEKDTASLRRYRRHMVMFIVAIPVFFIGFYAGHSVTDSAYQDYIYSYKSLRYSGTYEYVRPLLGTDSSDATRIGIYKDVKKKIQSIASNYHKNGLLLEYGVYVRSLSYPIWFGINEKTPFLPASLQKLPIAIAVYRDVEKKNLKKTDRFTYTKELSDRNKNDPFYAPSELEVGKSYSLSELVRCLIVSSDNGAKDLLVQHVQEDTLKETFKLGSLDGTFNIEKISPKIYSLYFRVLYNATFISEESSEELLKLLVEASYKNALVAGVPQNVKIAHKYGLYNEEANVYDLHDCGILYSEEEPYILCVMTRGSDVQALEDFISQVSSLVYKYQVSPK